MKSLLITLLLTLSSAAFALPNGGVECKNNNQTSDNYMKVKIVDGVASFDFWESSYDPIKMTATGIDTFAIIEEKVVGSGEGEEWITFFSAFLVYNSEKNELSVTTVFDKFVSTEVLFCN